MFPLELVEKILSYVDIKTLWIKCYYVNTDYRRICYIFTEKKFNNIANLINSRRYMLINKSYCIKSLLDSLCLDDYYVFREVLDIFKKVFINFDYIYKTIFIMVCNYHILKDNIDHILLIIPFLLKYSKTKHNIMKKIMLISKFFKKDRIVDHLSLELGQCCLSFTIDDIKSNTDNTLNACKFINNEFQHMWWEYCNSREYELLDLYNLCRNIIIEHNNLTGLYFLIDTSEINAVFEDDLMISLRENHVSISTVLLYCLLFSSPYGHTDHIYYNNIDGIIMTDDNRKLINDFKNTFGGDHIESFYEEYEDDVDDEQWEHLYEKITIKKRTFLENKLKDYGLDMDNLYEIDRKK